MRKPMHATVRDHVEKLAAREANRLTDADRGRIRTAVIDFLAESPWPRHADAQAAATRQGMHAIGCGAADLRLAEVAEIRLVVEAVTDAIEAN